LRRRPLVSPTAESESKNWGIMILPEFNKLPIVYRDIKSCGTIENGCGGNIW
jgi:hypothetical protein